jgi:hypothetical protein
MSTECQNKDKSGNCKEGISMPRFCSTCNTSLIPQKKPAVPVDKPRPRVVATKGVEKISVNTKSCVVTSYTARKQSKCLITKRDIFPGDKMVGITKVYVIGGDGLEPVSSHGNALFVHPDAAAHLDMALAVFKVMAGRGFDRFDAMGGSQSSVKGIIGALPTYAKIDKANAKWYRYQTNPHTVDLMFGMDDNNIVVVGVGALNVMLQFERSPGSNVDGLKAGDEPWLLSIAQLLNINHTIKGIV